MNTQQLRELMNVTYGMSKWPETYEVDHETYANICQFIFDTNARHVDDIFIEIAIGKHNGIMFKNVELILKK